MSFGLGRGKPLDDAPGEVGIAAHELPPMPDEVIHNPRAGCIDARAWFPSPERPLEIEIGSGKGTFLIQQAERQPETNFLGIEWAREFYEYAADRIRRRRIGHADDELGREAPDFATEASRDASLRNVRMLHTDASEFLRWRMPQCIARVIHLYFSDPWPKTKHHRRRVVQDRFLHEAARVLVPGGELRIVTDHDELWAWDCAFFRDWAADPAGLLDVAAAAAGERDVKIHRSETPASAALIPPTPTQRPFVLVPFVPPGSASEGELVGSNFERKYRREGRPFHALTLGRHSTSIGPLGPS
jgi:tRNA (guanine-N7-)-methyltransferase